MKNKCIFNYILTYIKLEFDVPNLNLPQQSNPARSYTDLNNHFVSQNQSVNSSLLSPDRIMAIHQRSKSTENSFSQATKLLIYK